MDKENWEHAKELFVQILDLPENERQGFFDKQTAQNPTLRALVQTLLDGEDISKDKDNSLSKMIGNEASAVLKDDFSEQNFSLTPVLNASQKHSKHASLKGAQIADYEIQNIIGEGGMGVVYLAKRKDGQFDQEVAIKIVQSHEVASKTIERFRQERQILASLQHPNIAQLVGGGETNTGLPYIVMEYVNGVNIVEYCIQHALSTDARLDLFKQVMSAVSYAHQNLVIHRDIKPNNVLVTNDGVVKLLDFGIAKLIEEKALPIDNNLTALEVKVLTPSNASPEQVKKEKVTTKTDVYGLSTLLYQMLTEQALFDTSTATAREVESWIVDRAPSKPSDSISEQHSTKEANLKSTLSGDLDTIILKGLQKDPERRYSSVEQFSQDIQFYLTSYPILAKPDSNFYKLTKFYKRNSAFTVLGVLFILCLIGFSSAVSYQAIMIAKAKDEAERESANARQISNFLSETFRAADPYYSGDKQVTPQDLIDNARFRINELDTDKLLKLQLMITIADVYTSIGSYDSASELLNSAYDFSSTVENLPEALRLQMDTLNVAVILDTSDLEKAREFSEKLLAKLRADYEDFDNSNFSRSDQNMIIELLISALSTHGTIMDRLGDDDTGLAVSQEALQLAEANPAISFNEFASLYAYMGHTNRKLLNYEESARWLLKSLDFAKATFGEFNLEIAYSYNQLASTYNYLEEFDEAIEMAEKGLEIRQALYPKGNAEIAASLGNLANIYYAKGDFASAVSYKRQSVIEIKRALGEEHVYVGATLMGLAGFLVENGEFEEAEENVLIALPIMKKNVPITSIDYARPYRLLGRIHYENGELSEAINFLSQALQICTQAQPNGHWLTAEVHAYLSLSYAAMNEQSKAIENKNQAVTLFSTIFGEDSKRAVNMRELLIDVE